MPAGLADKWIDDDVNKVRELERYITDNENVVTLVNKYQKDRWEVYSIDDVDAEYNDLNNNFLDDNEVQTVFEGTLTISFTRHQFNGCRDLDAEDDDYIGASFEINVKTLKLIIIGEDIPEERNTFEEF